MANDQRHIAVHEAGHAVVGRRLRMVCDYATIVADTDSTGHHMVAEHMTAWGAWDDREIYRSMDSAIRARVMTFMAGAEAELELLGNCRGGDGDDIQQAEDMVAFALGAEGEAAERLLARLRSGTRYLVSRHASLIARVADELELHNTLTGEALDEMVAGPLFGRPISNPFLTGDI